MTDRPDDSLALPAGLRERVLSASRLVRPAGQVTPGVGPIPPVEAFRRAADALDRLLGSLDPDRWARPVLRDLDVQGLVGHLAGVEDDVQRCLAGDPVVAAAGHVASTQAAAVRQAGRPRPPTPSGAAPWTAPSAWSGRALTWTPRWPCTACGCR